MTVRAQPLLVGARFEQAYTERQFALGEVCRDSEGGIWIFNQANGAIDKGALCKLGKDGQAVEEDTTVSDDNPTPGGFPQVALADNEYAFFFHGPGGGEGSGIVAQTANSITAGEAVTTTGTAGIIGTGGDNIRGLTTCSTTAGSGAPHLVEIHAATHIYTN